MSDLDNYLFSTGDDDEEYGLYLMEINCDLHKEGFFLMYYFDGDLFLYHREDVKKLFKPASEIHSCKDDMWNEYTGDKLTAYFRKCIKAYKEEYPGYVEYFKESEEKFKHVYEPPHD